MTLEEMRDIMFKFKKVMVILLMATMLITMVACEPSYQETNTKQTKELKVGMVTGMGPIDDKSFNQLAWEGLKLAERRLDATVSYKESTKNDDYQHNLEALYNEENTLIWGIGSEFESHIEEAAKKNPKQKYAILDFSYEDEGRNTPENVVCLKFNDEHSSFLVGYIAGKTSKSGKVGFIGGIKKPAISRFEYGYRSGVDYANIETGQGVEVLVEYADSFIDIEKGKNVARKIYQSGADIIFHAAGNAGIGVIELAKEEGKYVIGVDQDQNELAPENVITSAIKRVDLGTYNIIEDVINNEFKGGQTIRYGLKEGAVNIAPTSDKHLSKELLMETEKLKKKIISNAIDIPFNKETYESYRFDENNI